MDREINCHICSKFLGVIRDAKLHKMIRFVCFECSDDYVSEPIKSRSSVQDDQVVENLMRMFGMNKGR